MVGGLALAVGSIERTGGRFAYEVAKGDSRPMDTVRIETLSSSGTTDFVVLEGEFDMSTAPYLSGVISRLIENGRTRIAVDLENVQFIDSMGLSVLLNAQKELHETSGKLVLVTTHPRIHKFLALTGLSEIIPICRDRDEARMMLDQGAGTTSVELTPSAETRSPTPDPRP